MTTCEVLPLWMLLALRLLAGASCVAVLVGAALLALGGLSEDSTLAGLLCATLGGAVLLVLAVLMLPWTSRFVVD
ncbi:hypothetical protein, partial [Burkholderia cenocepacia]|uniref:hypothetical protein n=1 Tax=Burkholderia cenocepacia TaxID=95486 RepID=UPI0038CC03BF